MLFRTRVFVAFSTLGAMAVGGATLLIVSAHLNEQHQARTALAYETLSGYYELTGAIFRTFKQVRRDLVSGNGKLAADYPESRSAILKTVNQIEASSRSEAQFIGRDASNTVLENVIRLRREISVALDAIDRAAVIISSDSPIEGRALATSVLEGQVDVQIAKLMDAAIRQERLQLEAARADLKVFHTNIRVTAWVLVGLTMVVTAAVLLLLVRRFSYALGRLSDATQAYAEDKLDQRIDLEGQDELSDIARRLEAMAGQILTKRTALEHIRKELEHRVVERTAELSDVNDELKERERRRRQFFADIGHELRTPVTAIRGEAEVALRARTNSLMTQREALHQIVRLSARLTDIVDDLFLLAREQAGMLDFRNTLLDLNEPTRKAIGEMRALIEEAQAKIDLDLTDREIDIEGDMSRLVQLTRLLISNALDHGPRGVRITVRTYLDDKCAHLRISDNGPGVPAEDRRRIFDRYTRGHTSVARSASGTGLGLAIAKSIAQAHLGTISVEESVSGGAEFRIAFPRPEVRA